MPWRVRIRSSSFCNLSVMPELCRGVLVADVPSIAGSLDLVLGEIDQIVRPDLRIRKRLRFESSR